MKNIYENNNVLNEISKNKVDEIVNIIQNNNVGGVISVIGDRGFGKTTTLESLDILKCQNCTLNQHKSGNQCDISHTNSYVKEKCSCDYIVLDLIDPISIPKEYGVTSIILTQLHYYIKNNKTISIECQRNLIAKINNIISILNTKLEISKNEKFGESSETISKIASTINLTNNLNELIFEILRYFNKKHIIVRIDDFDILDPKHLYDFIIELNTALYDVNLDIVIGYRESQVIIDLIEKSYDNLCNYSKVEEKFVVKNELYSRVHELVRKTFPVNKSIYLENIDNFMKYNASNIEIFCKKNILENDDVSKLTIIEVYKKLLYSSFGNDWISYNTYEGFSVVFPSSPRDLIQKSQALIDIKNKNNAYESKLFFIHSVIMSKITDHSLLKIFSEFINSDVENKNYILFNNLVDYAYIKKIDEKIQLKKILVAKNISISDISYIASFISSNSSDKEDRDFIYLLKLYYSIYLKSILHKLEESISDYNGEETKTVNLNDNHLGMYYPFETYVGNEMFIQFFREYNSLTNYNLIYKEKNYFRNSTKNSYIYKSYFYDNNIPLETRKMVFMSIFSAYNMKSSVVSRSHYMFERKNIEEDTLRNIVEFTNMRDIYFDTLIHEKFIDTVDTFFGMPSRYSLNIQRSDIVFFDPFSLVLNMSYIYTTLKSSEKSYLFYNLFDIDYINDHKLFISSDTSPILTVFNRVYKLFKSDTINIKDNYNFEFTLNYYSEKLPPSIYDVFEQDNRQYIDRVYVVQDKQMREFIYANHKNEFIEQIIKKSYQCANSRVKYYKTQLETLTNVELRKILNTIPPRKSSTSTLKKIERMIRNKTLNTKLKNECTHFELVDRFNTGNIEDFSDELIEKLCLYLKCELNILPDEMKKAWDNA